MPLQNGSHLGPYTITAQLGAGGMGEVYRARDERLQRDVAIKVLREDASADADRQRRFAQEARAASALNHPNILTVHDVGMENGVAYIVAELVDGDSVEKLIARGKTPVGKVLDIAVQIASGLSAAHQAGILHRDLKPANLMLTRHGAAKILDFGLAKTVERPGPPLGDNSDATTTPGMIVGTATYMSPEQVRGEPLDFRSDQFSFGLVLYEMLTSQRAFVRSSAVTTMAAIVEERPKPPRELNPAVPAPLAWCVERCLSKDRNARYVSTADLQHELETIREHLDELATAPPPTPERGVRRRSRTWVAWVGLGCFVAGWLIAERWLIPESTVDLARYHIRPVANGAPWQGAAAWSPDGKSIAYAAQVDGIRQIFARDLGSPMAARITKSAADCNTPFWSPDGAKIYYFSADAQGPALWSAGATGGSPERVQENATAASVSPDGKTLAFLRADPTGKEPLSLWFLRGGAPERYTAGPFASPKFRTGYLEFSYDGKTLGLWLSRWDGGSEFWTLPFPGGAAHLAFSLALGANPFSWMPDRGHIVFGGRFPGSVGADLQVVDVSNGKSRPLTVTTRDAIEAAVAPDGRRIAFTAAQDDFDLEDVPLDGSPVRALLSTVADESDPAWSPSGTQLAYATNRTGSSQIWLRSPTEGWERPLVTEKDFQRAWIASFSEPKFSPEGQRIAYSVVGTEGHSVYVSNLAGGRPARLTDENADQRSPSWSPDGAWIAYLRNVNGSWALVKSSSGGGRPVVLREGCLPSHPTWQPGEGKWIAYQNSEGLAILSADGSETRTVSRDRWLIYGWSNDGKRIYGVKQGEDRRRMIAQVDIASGAEKTIGGLPLAGNPELSGFSLSADGKSFATSASHPAGAVWILEGFQRPGLPF